MVKIRFSQDSNIKEGSMFSLTEVDEAFRESDESQEAFNSDQPGDARVWIVSYETVYVEAEEMKMVAGTAFIGEGREGILENLQKEVEEHLNSQTWLDYKKAQGAEYFQNYVAELHDMQEHVLPYLQQYLSLEERGSIDILEEGTKEVSSGKESKAVTLTKPTKVKTIDEASKKSIHARLQEKKNELAKKPGKDNPQRKAVDELKNLYDIRKAYQRDELLKAMENSSRSYDEILAFITSENVPEDEEKQG